MRYYSAFLLEKKQNKTKKDVKSPQTNWHLQEKERKCALVFVGIKCVGGN